MSTVRRWTPDEADTHESPSGDYVLFADYAAQSLELQAVRELLAEARPIVFEDHMRQIGTRLLAKYTLTARIDAALKQSRGA